MKVKNKAVYVQHDQLEFNDIKLTVNDTAIFKFVVDGVVKTVSGRISAMNNIGVLLDYSEHFLSQMILIPYESMTSIEELV